MSMGVMGWLKDHYKKHEPLPHGFHTLRSNLQDGSAFRAHLRIEDDGNGILVINASKVIHLNQTAAEYAKLFIDGRDEEAASKIVAKRYKVSRQLAAKDFREFKSKILRLAGSSDVCPVSELDFVRIDPFTTPVSAPYRMDLALTYRCELNCTHCYAGGPRQTSEMNAAEWKQVLDKLFEMGIPHVCFTGGEATLREDLMDLIAHAEDLGLVSGLLTNGCRLSDAGYVRKLIDAGLDHVQITIESHDPQIHNKMVGGEGFDRTVMGIKNSIKSGLYTVTNTTITSKNKAGIGDCIRFIHGLGVTRFAMNGIIRAGRSKSGDDALSAGELSEELALVKEIAAELGMNFIWYTPTRYCDLNPVELGLGIKSCTAGLYNMCVEPDGSVIPCQSYFESLGNILKNPWPSIWNHPLLKNLRSHSWVEDECNKCAELGVCGGGCPLGEQEAEVVCTESLSNY